MPGTAFCDNCGAALPPPQPAADDADATAGVGAAPIGAGANTAGDGGTVTCSQCGTANDPSNHFCDSCGATLADASQALGGGAAAAPTDDTLGGVSGTAPAVSDQAVAATGSDMSASTALPTEGTTMPTLTEAPGGAAVPDEATVAPVADAGTAPVIDATVVPPAAQNPEVERQRLEEAITTQRQLVEQLEQMRANFGAATPAAILQGLDEARANLARSEAALATLPPARPPVDPAEVARLEETVTTHRRMVEQLEQMQANFGAATPAAILQGLDEARANLARSETELRQLTGGAPAHPLPTALDVATQRAGEIAQQGSTEAPSPTAPQTPATPATSGVDTVSAAQAPATPVPAPAPVSAAPAPAPTPQPVPAAAPQPQRGTDQLPPAPVRPAAVGPRLVTRDGKEIPLPRTGAELVVGREDPISGIHPDVDLTQYGGEAGGVSRRHAVLREQSGQWLVTDLDSTNYTRVDGNRLAPNTPTPLHDGARVQFGRVELDFRMA